MADESDGPRRAGGSGGTDGWDPGTSGLAQNDADDDSDAVDERFAAGLTDDGVLLFVAGAAGLLAAATAYDAGQPRAVAVFGALAGAAGVGAFLADVVSEYVPGTGVELLVGGAAVVGALFTVRGRYYLNLATLTAAAALVLWRVVDVEHRGAER